MKAEVEKAITAIRNHYVDHHVVVWESPCGGAYVRVDDVALGPPYTQTTTWVGFFITNACPFADTYPFYVRADLSRADQQPLKVPIHIGNNWQVASQPGQTFPAVMVSRRQNHAHCLGRESPLLKLQTVMAWMLKQ